MTLSSLIKTLCCLVSPWKGDAPRKLHKQVALSACLMNANTNTTTNPQPLQEQSPRVHHDTRSCRDANRSLTCLDACRIQTPFKSYKQDNLIFTPCRSLLCLSGIPAATSSTEPIRRGFNTVRMKQKASDVTTFDRLMDSNPLFLIGNKYTVVYTSTTLELDWDGPRTVLVVVPPKCGSGMVDNAWQRFVVNMGDPGLGRGGKNSILLPAPDHKGDFDPPRVGAGSLLKWRARSIL